MAPMFVHSLASIPVSIASDVFEHAFLLNFDDTIASKAMALTRGNLKMACSFIQRCIDTTDMPGRRRTLKVTISEIGNVENGSLKLPWKSNLITSQLEHMDIYAREIAQILSVVEWMST